MKKNKSYCFFFYLLLFLLNAKAQASFIPSDLSGLKFWINADSIEFSIFPKILKCYDLSAHLNDASQPNINKQPVVITSVLNGHNIVRFDGNALLNFNLINDIRTVFWVVNENVNSVKKGLLLGNNSNYNFYRTGGEIWNTTYTNPAILSGITRLNNFQINGTIKNMPTVISLLSLVTTSSVSAESFSIDRTDQNKVWDGDLAEIIIYDQPLTMIDVLKVEQYLSDKYAPSIKLPYDITTLNSLCDTIVSPINPNNNQYTYQWSNGAATPTISVNKSGKYWLKAINIFGKESSDTIQINLPNYHIPKLNYICKNDSLIWNTSLPKNNFTFLWQDGLTTDSVYTITQPGNYHVKITDNFGCHVESDTITATIDNFSTIASLGPDTNLCAGNPINLKAGMQTGLTYTWSNGSNNPTLPITTTGQYSVVVTNTNGCVAKDTVNVTIIGQAPTANYLSGLSCKNYSVSFTDGSAPPIGNTLTSWLWNFGDATTIADTSTILNPYYTFSDTGNYQVNLTVTSNIGCKQSVIKNIHVAPNPITNFNNVISCKNDSALFSSTSTSANYMPLTYNWNFGDALSGANNTASNLNPKHLFNKDTLYTVSLITTNNAGCKTTNTKTITVKAEVTASFSTTATCVNQLINFTDNSIVPQPNNQNIRIWNFGNGNTSQGLTVPRFYTMAGIYPVTLTVTGSNNCVSSITKLIDVGNKPLANFLVSNVCLNDTLQFTDLSLPQSGGLVNWNWKNNTTVFSTTQNATLTANTATTNTIKLNVTNSLGCKDSVIKPYSVYALPVVDYTTSPQNYYTTNSSVTFTPSVLNATTYNWSFSNQLNFTNTNPTLVYTTAGTYTSSLFLTDNNGCSGFKTKQFMVSDVVTDVAITNVSLLKLGADYLTVVADIVNYGSSPLTKLDVTYSIPNASNVKETWQGILIPNALITYTFLASSKLVSVNDNNPICVSVNLLNNEVDVNLNNNSLCTVLNANTIDVLNPYPNPSDNNVTLPIILTKDLEFTIEIFDALGQKTFEQIAIKGLQGLNQITIPILNFTRGTYILKVYIDGKIFIKKLVKAGK